MRGWKLEVMGAAVNVLSLFPCGGTCCRLKRAVNWKPGFKYEEESGSQE